MNDFRTPRNTSRAFREDPAEPLLLLAEAMATGSPESSILRQEADGQRQMVNSDVIPTRLNGCTEADLEALGFALGPQVDGDPLFRRADLPPGWGREGSDHSMGSYIVDADGFRRCSVFYKAAFYDRDANLSLVTLYWYVSSCVHDKVVPQVRGDWATRDAVLAALAEVRTYHADKVAFWTEHSNAGYVQEHEAGVQLCDRFREALTAETSS
jgi:hypothetical protein